MNQHYDSQCDHKYTEGKIILESQSVEIFGEKSDKSDYAEKDKYYSAKMPMTSDENSGTAIRTSTMIHRSTDIMM